MHWMITLYVVGRLKSVNIQSLQMGHAYLLRVTAGNLYGFGAPSEPVSVSLDEEEHKQRKISQQETQTRGKKIKVDDYDKFCEFTVAFLLRPMG